MARPREIKIVGVSAGEAPQHVREAWVGLVFPIVGNGEYRAWTSGVLTGARTPLRRIWAALRGRWKRREGYVVDSAVAVFILERERPDAARWWRENAPHLLRARRRFVFESSVCQLQ